MNYINRKLRKLQQLFVPFFQNTAFFMQGQMDISPDSRWYNEEFVNHTGGFYPKRNGVKRQIHSLDPWDNTRRDMIVLLLRTILEKDIPGDFVELGVYKGLTARLIHHYAPARMLHLFDTFEGFPEESMQADKKKADNVITKKLFGDTSVGAAQNLIAPKNNNVKFYKGFFPATIPENFKKKKFAFIHLDADLYQPVLDGLKFFYRKMSKGGLILVHDYNAWIGARKAVDQFFEDKGEIPIPMPDKSGSVLIQKL
jgi:O-methyltransferase